MQVWVEPVIVPAERVAVRSEPLVQLGSQVRLAQPVVIAKDAAFGHTTVLLAGQSGQTN